MIDIEDRFPNRRRVAILTNICRLYVRDVLAGCFNAVVTTDTIAHDVGVVEYCRSPRC